MGLVLVYANTKKLKNPLTYLLMYIAAIPVYAIMIRFFGDYFGVNISKTLELVNTMLPPEYGANTARQIVVLSIGILPLMESFIMKISSQLVVMGLMKSDKFKSRSNNS